MSSDDIPHATIERAIGGLVEESLRHARITVVQGARQVGKSTLASAVARRHGGRLVTLDDPATLAGARADPVSFVRQFPASLLVIDEAQRAPELVLPLKLAVDDDPRPGRFLVTGSADLLRMPGSADSLAGRAQTVELHPFTQGELNGVREDFLDRAFAGDQMLDRHGTWNRADYIAHACAGGFPEALRRPAGRARTAWWRDYLERVLTRDAQEQARLPQADRLPGLLRLLATRHTHELVASHVSTQADLPARSLPSYLDVLQRLYLIALTPSWSANLTRRETDRRRIHLTDSGMVAHLLALTPERLSPNRDPSLAGQLLEGFTIEQLRRQVWWAQAEYRLFGYRTYDRREVDAVIEAPDGRVVAIDVKASATVRGEDLANLRWFAEHVGDRCAAAFLLHAGTTAVPFGPRLAALPISAVWNGH